MAFGKLFTWTVVGALAVAIPAVAFGRTHKSLTRHHPKLAAAALTTHHKVTHTTVPRLAALRTTLTHKVIVHPTAHKLHRVQPLAHHIVHLKHHTVRLHAISHATH